MSVSTLATGKAIVEAFKNLPETEQWATFQTLRDSLQTTYLVEMVPPTDEEVSELDRRIEKMEADPSSCVSFEELDRELKARFGE